LGVPFNIASLALMTNLFAKCAGLQAGEILWTGVDCHLYLNHLEAAKEQLTRSPYDFPKLKINKNISTLEDILMLFASDLLLEGYKCHSSIKAEMAI
jgi:thymidylate synthase